VVTPSDDLGNTFMNDSAIPALGTQYTTLVDLEKEFVEEFAPARTFCFLSEVEMLKEAGLIKGGGLDTAVVIYDSDLGQVEVDRIRKVLNLKEKAFVGKTGIINDIPLRFENEPVRHKTLDLLGDLLLIGVPFKGHVLAARSGHKANVALAKKMRELYQKRKIAGRFSKRPSEILFDINSILEIMPHRYPFLMIDRIIDLVPDKSVTAIKNVTINEPFFQGHFPGHPIMPGVMILEAMAQAGGVLLLNAVENPKEKVVYFMGIDNARFRRPVMPGDQLRFQLTMKTFRRNTCKMVGEAFVDDNLVANADCQGTRIASSALIAKGAHLGENITVAHGAVISSIPQDLKFGGEESTVVVGDGTTIREYATINRGTVDRGETTIGRNCLLMAYSHVAHDCLIGDDVILANSVNLAGHIQIDDHAILGGMLPVHQFVKIGTHCMIGGGFRVQQDICPYALVGGYPLKVIGLNAIGMKRRGFSPEVLRSLQKVFKLLFFSSLNTTQAVEKITSEIDAGLEVQVVLDFIKRSKRGIVK